MQHCPPDEELIAFALGKLEDARLAVFHAHLDACVVCQQVLAEAAHAFATAVTAPLSEDADFNTTFRPGTVVADRYVISRFIARGAMGEVYEAYDRELAQRVALKTVASTACDNSRAVRRLKDEVQLARRVSHPNVCRIYDFGTHVMPGTGVQLHFLTMEFVEGETLGQRVRLGGALPPTEALGIARELLLALRAAHGAGVLHRDFKSDNVMLKLRPIERSSAVVLDFGLARDVDHAPPASVSHPTFVGTFGYMAPEVLEGTSHSTASDVYSFGVVWFEMLTGQLPFEGATSPARALQCLEAPAPAPTSFNVRISRDLERIVLRCLARAPHDRFSTASDVLDALDALDGRRPSSVRPVTARARQPTAPALRIRLVPLLGLLAVGVTAAYWVGSRQPKLAPAPAAPLATEVRPAVVPTGEPSMPAGPNPRAADVPTAVTTTTTNLADPAAPSAARAPVVTYAARQRGRETPRRNDPAPATTGTTAVESSAPSVPSAASAVSAAPTPVAPTPPAPLTPPRPAKPNWENPFGAAEKPARVAGRTQSPI